jgi:hypothetical protein
MCSSPIVLKGAPFDLTAKFIEAVRDWRFEPALKDGNPVPVAICDLVCCPPQGRLSALHTCKGQFYQNGVVLHRSSRIYRENLH